MNDLILGLIIFILTYVLMIAIPNYRAHVAVTSAALFVILGLLPISEILPAIDFNVLMMIAGTMGIVSLFIESKMPSLLADYIIDKMPNVKWVVISLSVFAGIISAFVDNVATVLMVAPVAITVADKLNIKPVKMVIAIAIASNLQGAATLVGDTTSILLGGYANMNFMDFIIYDGKPGMFFVVQLAMIAATAVLYFVFKEYNQEVHLEHFTEVEDYFPTFLLVGTILSLIIASFIPNTPDLINGYICMAYLILGIIVQSKKTSFTHAISLVKADMDFFTLFLLAGLFVVIGGISYVGVIDEIANIFVKFGSDNIFVLYTIIVFASVILSAFIDNIPYVATMLPVVTGIAIHLVVDPTLLYFGLLSGATLGGNLTPIGASANITAIGILKKNGHEVPSSTFMKISIPYTLAAVFTGYVLIWFLFG